MIWLVTAYGREPTSGVRHAAVTGRANTWVLGFTSRAALGAWMQTAERVGMTLLDVRSVEHIEREAARIAAEAEDTATQTTRATVRATTET